MPDDEAVREVALEAFEQWSGPFGARSVPTAGLHESEAAALLDLIAAEVGPEERFAWLGLSSELSPAVLALGLYQRGASAARVLRPSETDVDIVPAPGAPEPDWDTEAFREWAGGFDVVFFTDPPDLKDRAHRRAARERWQRPLVQNLGYTARRLGVVEIGRGRAEPVQVGLFACRLRP